MDRHPIHPMILVETDETVLSWVLVVGFAEVEESAVVRVQRQPRSPGFEAGLENHFSAEGALIVKFVRFLSQWNHVCYRITHSCDDHRPYQMISPRPPAQDPQARARH